MGVMRPHPARLADRASPVLTFLFQVAERAPARRLFASPCLAEQQTRRGMFLPSPEGMRQSQARHSAADDGL